MYSWKCVIHHKFQKHKDDNLELEVTSEETEEEAPKSKSVKTKKKGTAMNRVPKESKLDEKEKMIGEIMMQLKDKYVCNHYNHKHCFVKDGRHLFLSNVSFSMWAQDIICTYFWAQLKRLTAHSGKIFTHSGPAVTTVSLWRGRPVLHSCVACASTRYTYKGSPWLNIMPAGHHA
ncbi:hypothetical protein RhiirA1_398325 [Rhizophagus irregularis]|uniref:Uncharacterized protein n=1 Tax=Rhizophagus irregularis TaxID=588596 RepID=A0A2N0RE17_9GLOM|nr:hypothetical protein RhiirA1_398325 [Rhizophagus irregularis]